MPDEGIVSLAEAFGSAESELGLADSSVEATTQPVVDSQDASAPNTQDAEATDTPDEEQGTEDANLEGFADMFTKDGEQAAVDTASPDFLQLQVAIDTVAGSESVTIEELQKGYLRQADYTRKTQEVADQRRAAVEAVEFWETFRNDPQEFARAIAVRAGFIEEGATPIKQIEAAKIPTAEAIEEMVEERVQERLASEPAMREAKLAAAREAVRQTFEGIESKHNLTLDKGSREAVIAEANRRGTTDLELVFEAMLGQYRSNQPKRPAASNRPTGAAGGEKPAAEKIPDSVTEAFKMAEADLAGS